MKSPLKTIKIGLAVCAVLAVEIAVYWLGGAVSVIAFSAFGVMVTLLIGFMLTRRDPKNVFDRHKKGSIMLATVAGCVFVIACCFEPFFAAFFDMIETRLAGADLFSYYTAQLSLTFISISVMSVLSDKSVIIYWANVSEDRLIRPTFTCFAAYTYYSIGATVGAGIGVALDHAGMFVLFFAVNVGVLILLTISMIDVYYGRDTKKEKLAKTLCPYTDLSAYENKILGLEQNLLKAADEKDVMFLREVYELCIAYPGKFDIDIGREAVAVMVSTLNVQTTGPFLRALDQSICERLNHFPPKSEAQVIHGYDTGIWMALGSDRASLFLEQISVTADGYSSPNALLFAKVLMRRLTLEYNTHVYWFAADKRRKGQEINPERYYISDNLVNSIYEPKTPDRTPITFEWFEEVFNHANQTFRYNAPLFASLIRLMDRVMKDGQNWYTVTQLSALPFVKYWASEEQSLYDTEALARLMDLLETEKDVNNV